MEQEYKILIVEDFLPDCELTKREVKKVLPNAIFRNVETEGDFLRELKEFEPHIILSDYSMPEFDGLSALRLTIEHSPITPVIIVTGSVNEETAVECMRAGAANYVIKEQIVRLGTAILKALEERKNNIERLKAREALIESEARYRALFNLSPVGIILQNESGEVIDVNREFSVILGYTREEMLGQHISMITPPENIQDISDDIETIITEGSYKHEAEGLRKDGEVVNVELTEARVVLPDGSAGIMTILADITARKKYEKELILAKEEAEEMNRLKSSFLANMSHELRTPMIGILGYSDLLTEEGNPPQVVEYADIIYKSGSRLMNTLNLILDLSRIEAGKLEMVKSEIDAVETVRENFRLHINEAKKKGLDFELVAPEVKLPFVTDERIFSQICANLINNAIKFTKTGLVKVEVSSKNLSGNGYLLLKVRDTGIGIAKEEQAFIFDDFRQASEGFGRNFEGTGLGLAVTKKFVEKLNGTIQLDSEVGTGTTFTVSLPIQNPRAGEVFESVAAPVQTGEAELPTILYVEDDPIAIEMIARMLRKICKIESAISSKEALEKATSNHYPLILMDVNLGRGLDGYQTTVELRKLPQYKETPVIALTAFAMLKDKEDAMRAGCTHYMSKPFKREAFVTLVRDSLSKR
ncbi:MAG: response regulator [Bacteroidetes bacterium]|nr:response regulator [Bacteroidota bacterium]